MTIPSATSMRMGAEIELMQPCSGRALVGAILWGLDCAVAGIGPQF